MRDGVRAPQAQSSVICQVNSSLPEFQSIVAPPVKPRLFPTPSANHGSSRYRLKITRAPPAARNKRYAP